MESLLDRLSGPESALLEAARAFRREAVAPQAAEWERRRSVPLAAFRQAAAIGLTGIEVPRGQGGQGGGFLAKLLIAEELARSCMGFAFALINTHNVAAKIARDGSKAQVERYLAPLLAGEMIGCTSLTEPGAGSDFPAIGSLARRDAGGWVIDGEKAWATNATIADVAITYVKTEQAPGTAGIAAFLIDAHAPGFERLPGYGLMGGHAIGAGGFRLAGYRAAADDLFLPPGPAFKRALTSINGARTYVAAMCCGMVDEALGLALDHARTRHAFGKPIIEHQGLRWSLVEVATDLEAARLLTYRAATVIAGGGDAVLESAYAKKFAVRMAQARLGDCLQAMGAEGLRETVPIGRHIACARIAGFVDGSTEMQNERIGAALVRR
jgi:alkylation response protein AidB-like acyl-CoA dehydrogenase